MTESSTSLAILRIDGPRRLEAPDRVAVEEPLEIRLGYDGPEGRATRSISVTMRTPGHDVELALGFLFGEGIVNTAADVKSAAPCGTPAPDSGLRNVVRVELAAGVIPALDRLQRNFYTTSSCGVCGKSSLQALSMAGEKSLAGNPFCVRAALLGGLPAALRARQRVFADTGGLHAAALFDRQGLLSHIHEDVGRHNAVDKLVGSALRAGALPAAQRGILVSGRASFELMQKALRAGIPMLVAVGAPSSLAVKLAREFGMTLAGFLSVERFNIYAGEQRILQS